MNPIGQCRDGGRIGDSALEINFENVSLIYDILAPYIRMHS